MAHAENEIVIDRPVETVYAFLSDGTNNPKWRPGVRSIELKSGSGGHLGAVYRQVLSGPGGRAVDGDYEIIRAERGVELAFQVVSGPARPTGVYRLAPAGQGSTRLRFSLDYSPKGFMRLMG